MTYAMVVVRGACVAAAIRTATALRCLMKAWRASVTVSRGSFTRKRTAGISARQSGQRRPEFEAGSFMKQPRHKLWPQGSATGLMRTFKQQGHWSIVSIPMPLESSPLRPRCRKSRHSNPVSRREILTRLAAGPSVGSRYGQGMSARRGTPRRVHLWAGIPSPHCRPGALRQLGRADAYQDEGNCEKRERCTDLQYHQLTVPMWAYT